LHQLSRSVVQEINLVSQLINNKGYSDTEATLIEKSIGLEINLYEENPYQLNEEYKKESIIFQTLRTELSNSFKKEIYIKDLNENDKVSVVLQFDTSFMEFIFYKKRINTSRNHIFLGWQIISSLILIIISMLFLKNQIKPITNLARAAESFGKGQNIDDFKVSGAAEVRLASKEFLKMKDRIVKQIDQRSLMLAGVSHDLKTPLTRIRLQTESIKEDEIKQSLNDEVQHMNEMLNEYLEFSSTEQQTKGGNISPIEAILKIKNDINFKDKNIEVEVTEDTGSVVNANIFNRVIINVLNNSVLHADHIKILIEINSQLILVSIHDNGPGIPDDEKERVFKPFYRIDKSRNQNKTNSGLGLSISKSLLSQINGSIALKDSFLGGLEVKIEIENK
jgi:two-component system osmolarity sensor histidine kinase EnvZ